jgi:kanosamine 6-kinase
LTMRVGLDIGATKLAVRVEAGNRAHTTRVEWVPAADARGDLALLRDTVALALAGRRVDAAGVASAPSVGADGRVVRWPNRPWWVGVPLRAELRKALGVEPTIEDDCAAAALAESATLGVSELLYVGIGTGIGSGVIVGRRLYRGGSGQAGELGHLLVDPGGPPCSCGRRGCLQAIASGRALLARASERRGQPIGPGAFSAAVRAHDTWARTTLREAAAALGVAVSNVCQFLDIGRVVIGGGVAAHVPQLVSGVRAYVRGTTRPGFARPVVGHSIHEANASLMGAMYLAREGASESRREAS